MAVYERTSEIGTLKAILAANYDIRWLFTFDGGELGFTSGAIGLLIDIGLGQVKFHRDGHFFYSSFPALIL